MGKEDEILKWLLEQQVNSFLVWIGLWLVCLLGSVTILTEMSLSVITLTASHSALLSFLYGGLVVAMMFSIHRISMIISIEVRLANQINTLREHFWDSLELLSKLAVDKEGKIRRVNLLLAYSFHVIAFSALFYVALQ